MKKKILVLIVVASVAASLFAFLGDSSSLGALEVSALRSPSYWGSFDDVYVNPAALPLVKGGKFFKLSLAVSESYDTSLFSSEPSPYFQNLNNEAQGIVAAGPVAVTAKFSNKLASRAVQSGRPYFDIYTGIDIEIDFGYRIFKNFAFGMSLSGGNSLIRENKCVENVIDVVQNALFSPYEKSQNSERFIPTLGLLLFNDNFSFGCTMSSRIEGDEDVSRFFMSLLSNTTVAFSYQGNTYSSNGDLKLLVPKAGAHFSGFGGGAERSLSVSGDLTLQFLKNVYLDFGAKFLYLVNDYGVNNILALSILGGWDDFTLSINLAFNSNKVRAFSPSIVFTYSG